MAQLHSKNWINLTYSSYSLAQTLHAPRLTASSYVLRYIDKPTDRHTYTHARTNRKLHCLISSLLQRIQRGQNLPLGHAKISHKKYGCMFFIYFVTILA